MKKSNSSNYVTMYRLMGLSLIVTLLFTGCSLIMPKASIELAEKYMDKDKIDKAIEVYETLIDEDEEDYEAWLGLAELYMDDKEYEDAADVLEDMGDVILDNYDEDDRVIKRAIDDYMDLRDDLEKEEVMIDDLEVSVLEVMIDSPQVSAVEIGGSPLENGDTIKIGFITPKTGDLAVYGIAVENAVILAVNKVNAEGGINGKDIELIVYDNKADATESINVFNRLVDNDKIVALVGPIISSTSLAVGPLAEAAGIPMISPTATNLGVTPDYEYVFRACYTDPYQGAMVAKFANEYLMARKGAILYNAGDDYSSGLANAFEDAFTGEIVVKEGYTAEDIDFRALLISIKDSGAEVVFVPDYYNTIGLIATQAREVGLEAVLLGGDGWDAVQTEYGDVTEGYYFANHYSITDGSPLVQGFISDYTAAYGDTPNALAALGYDALMVMAAAIDHADSLEGADILASLKATDLDVVTGHITFDDNGDTKKEVAIIKIENGQLVLETKVSE